MILDNKHHNFLFFHVSSFWILCKGKIKIFLDRILYANRKLLEKFQYKNARKKIKD